MLPMKIRMQAFASYAEAVEIDFEKLDSLFLIHGATGSGKTAILDAMMYALYGKSSGDGRSTFRCALPAAENIPTEVEFTFRSGGKLYKFTRTIRVNPKNKKEESKQDCFVFDEAEGIFRAIYENPIATRVNDEAVKITGLEADQFRQVVILPQGQFERLLTSSTKDKEKTFSTLFAADKYTEISGKLDEKKSTMKDEIEKEEEALQAVLSTEGAKSVEELEAVKEKLEKDKETLAPMIKEAEIKLKKSRESLTAAEVTAEKFKSMEDSVKKLSELDKLSERIAFVKAALVKNSEAAKLRPEFAETISSAESLSIRSTQLEAARLSDESAARNFNVVAEKGKAVREGEKLYKEKLSRFAVLSGLADVYGKIGLAEGRKSKAERELADVERSCLMYAESAKKSNSDIEKLTAEQNEIQDKYALALPELLSRRKALEAGAEAEKKCTEYRNGLKRIEAAVAEMKKEAAALEKVKAETEKNYDRLYGTFIANTAAELSSSLKEGLPCPVCGSTHHPCPAQLSGTVVTSEDVKKAKSDFEAAYDLLAKKNNEIATQENRIPDGHNHIAEKMKIMEECGYSAEKLRKVSEEADFAQKKNDMLPELRKKIAKLNAQLLDLRKKSDEAAQRKLSVQGELSAARAEIETLRNQLDKNYPDAVSYNAGVTGLKAEIEGFEKVKSAFDEEMKLAENNRVKTAEALKKAEEEILAAQKSCENANKEFSVKLSQAGFPTVEEYKAALLPEKNAAEYSTEAEKYELERHSLNERITQLKNELEGKEKPQLDLIRQEAEALQKEYGEKAMELSAANQKLLQLEKLIKDCGERFAETKKKREKFDKLEKFADFMVGKKGMSFTRYILGIMLRLVVEEANSILSDVHGGRFRLCVKEMLMANSKQGLDLEVETTTADGSAVYGVKDLSGGEKFLISLALSLGLSSVVQSRSGGIKIDAMFIDEGFGSLDTALLREAVGILCGLTAQRSTIGIISHVSELKSIIPCGISVAKDKDGSSTILSTV